MEDISINFIGKITEIYFDDHLDENLDKCIKEVAKKAAVDIVDDNCDEDDHRIFLRAITLPVLVKIYKANYDNYHQIDSLISEDFFRHLTYGYIYSFFVKDYYNIYKEVSKNIKTYYDRFYKDEAFFSDVDTDDEM